MVEMQLLFVLTTDRKSIGLSSKYGGIDVWVNGVGTVRDALFLRKKRRA